jgi:membrane-associated phospholipid phosphatase
VSGRRPIRRLPEPLASALRELGQLDDAVYLAVAATPTPTLDAPLRRLSNAANYSQLWAAVAAGLALAGGSRGRRAALEGLTAIGVGSASANLLLKQLAVRPRPERAVDAVSGRQVVMPASSSFPSGHTVSAFAFATAASTDVPAVSTPLHLLATAVGYSRVHTGVHYPGDVIVGAIFGSAVGRFSSALVRRKWPSPRN